MPSQILVAEDNMVNQSVIRAFLVKLGYQVSIVSDGAKSISSFENMRPDLVLMDCNMPLMDGMEATRRIRQLESDRGWQRTPVLALTAHGPSEIMDACREAGMDDHISKPVIFDQLRETLVKWLESR